MGRKIESLMCTLNFMQFIFFFADEALRFPTKPILIYAIEEIVWAEHFRRPHHQSRLLAP